MSLEVWQQEEWHGMARRGVWKKDPFTSKLEVNTEPGVERLRKITSRMPYLSEGLPHLAGHFHALNTIQELWCSSAGSARMAEFDTYTYDCAGVVCFSVADYNALDTSLEYPIFTIGSGPATPASVQFSIYLHYTSGSWYLYLANENTWFAVGTEPLVSGSWYWALGILDATGGEISLTYYKDGSAVAIETVNDTGYVDSSANFKEVSLGGSSHGDPTLLGGSISFASWSSTKVYPTPWVVNFERQGGNYDFVYYPFDPRKDWQPALIGDTTDYYHWRANPRYDAELSAGVGNSTLGGTGLRSANGKSYLLSLDGEQLFSKKTVFLFDYEVVSCQGKKTLLRTSDSSFSIALDTSIDAYIRWAPADPSAGADDLGGLAEGYYSAKLDWADWFAVEVDPINKDGENNIKLYTWTSATGSWTERTVTSGTVSGNGVLKNTSTELIFNESACAGQGVSGGVFVSDFRMISGDDDWTTNYTTATMASSVPAGLDVWLQHDDGATWPLAQNAKTLSQRHSVEQRDFAIAVTNRVNGKFQFKVNPYSSEWSWFGCPYTTNGMYPTVEDVLVDADGEASGTSNAYYFKDIVASAQKMIRSDGRPRISAVGEHRYIVGTSPLQYVSDVGRSIGWGPAEVDCHYYGTAAASATLDYKGELDWSGDYEVKVTHYNPITGDESNSYGPYRFTTDAAPSTTSPSYGNLGCALKLVANVWTQQNLSGQALRFYRYHSGDGAFYLEGQGSLGTVVYDSTEKRYYFPSTFTLALSDDDLSLQKELEYDNDSPPLHLFSTIWGSRAFYVDALIPSRVYFSKKYQLGAVPRTNVLWTDEGIGGDIVGFLPGMGGLLILRERSIWVIPEFASDDAAFIQPLIPDIGVVSGAAAVFSDSILWWASPGGIYSFDGNQVTNHSERLDGIDRSVFSECPAETTAYYDRTNWKVVFACAGAGISFDVRTGAAALVSAPETCATEVNSSDYSGPVFGAAGMVFKEVDGSNKSLTLDFNGNDISNNPGKLINAGTIYINFIDESTTYSAICGFTHTSINAASATYMTSGTHVGRTMTQANTALTSLWSLPIQAVSTPTAALFQAYHTAQVSLWINSFPMHYESQDLFLGRMADGRCYERIDFVTDETVADSAKASYTFESLVPSGASAMVASATTVWTYKQNVMQLPIRLRGNQARYTVYCDNFNSFPEIVSVGVHFRVSPPRGRKT